MKEVIIQINSATVNSSKLKPEETTQLQRLQACQKEDKNCLCIHVVRWVRFRVLCAWLGFAAGGSKHVVVVNAVIVFQYITGVYACVRSYCAEEMITSPLCYSKSLLYHSKSLFNAIELCVLLALPQRNYPTLPHTPNVSAMKAS